MEYRELYNGVKIPMLGFGVFQIPDHIMITIIIP